MAVDESHPASSSSGGSQDGGPGSHPLGSLDGSVSSLASADSFSSNGSSTGSSSVTGNASHSITSTSSSTSGDGAPWRGPKQLLGVARWAARPEVQPWLGTPYAARGILGVAQLDSFGDVVPPKALSAARDGAIGWIRREGAAPGGARGWARLRCRTKSHRGG
jgi:hypothetical protein